MGSFKEGMVAKPRLSKYIHVYVGDPKMRKGLLFAQRTPFREKDFYFCEKDFYYG